MHREHDIQVIGRWGEQLVNSFLCHWRDSHDPDRPTHVLWCNQDGESGWPYDFKLTFGATGKQKEVFVEAKSTSRKEKAYIQISVNELEFAMTKQEGCQLFLVFSAGDPQNVRLYRIRNLAKQLQNKSMQLFLFV